MCGAGDALIGPASLAADGTVPLYWEYEKPMERLPDVIAEFGRRAIWDDPIVTEVVPLDTFYAAEEYHQDYYRRNLDQPYCQAIVAPKVAKARKLFLEKLKQA